MIAVPSLQSAPTLAPDEDSATFRVDVVLSTDGHDVMDTTLVAEFKLARDLMQLIQAGDRKIRISYEQAVAMNAQEGGHANIEGAKPQSIIEVNYAQLSEKRRGFIDNAYRKFFETAQRYVAQQAQHGRDALGGKP